MRRIIRSTLAVAFLATTTACSISKRAVPVPEPVIQEIDGLANARVVGTDLLFGAQPTREALVDLAARGYRTVLTTRGEGELQWSEASVVDSLGMRFVAIPMANPVEEIRDEWVEQFDAVMRDAERPVLLHCSSGNRVAGLWAVWLAERAGVDRTRALELGEKAGMTRVQAVVEKRLGVSAGN